MELFSGGSLLRPLPLPLLLLILLSALPSSVLSANPACSSDIYFVSSNENAAVGTAVLTLSDAGTPGCTDSDGDTITYSNIESGNTGGVFQLDANTGKISFAISPNAEQITSVIYDAPYVLVIVLTDGTSPGPTKITVVVDIVSLNEFTPTITNLNAVSLAENTAVATSVAGCTLADSDRSDSSDSTVTVAITGGNTAGHFAINPSTCDVRLVKPLDYETTTSFSIVVEAADAGTSPSALTATATLAVTVTDVNDNSPVCSPSVVCTSVNDGTASGNTVTTLACTDGDTADSITYALLSGDTTRLSVGATTGVVTLASAVDTEAGDTTLSVLITATDSSTTATVTVSVHVIDIDDNIPAFQSTPYTGLTATAGDPVGTSVYTVAVSDADGSGTPSEAHFDWTSDISKCNNTPTIFLIDPLTGRISVYNTISAGTWDCEVVVYSGTNTGSTATEAVTITIAAANTDSPVFKESGATVQRYAASVAEAAFPQTGAVTTVTATDSNTPVTFALVNTGTPFAMDSSTGILTQISPCDYETTTEYLLAIRAVDGASTPATSTAYILVSVTAVNDFTPVITNPGAQTVNELDTPGNLITTIAVSDSDSGDDGTVKLTLQDSNVPFILEADSGQLLVADGLDADTTSSYQLVVLATDQSTTTKRTASATFTVTVSDGNDNSPTCNSIGDVIIKPDTNIGVAVATLTCTDLDTSTQNIAYTEASGDTNDYFLVDNVNGEIRVRSTNTAPGTYTLVVDVTDGGTNTLLTTSVPVTIYVEVDLTFDNEPLTGTVSESTAIGSSIYGVSATGAYEAITYSIVSGNSGGEFHLDQSSGQLTLVKTLDRETTASYNLVVRATTTNAFTKDSTLDLIVSDYNDITPTYANSYFTFTYVESTAPTVLVSTIAATDTDLANNAVITYSIQSGNTAAIFTYDSAGGLYITGQLDYETAPSHTLILQAVDGGSPALTGTTIVYILVTNVIDTVPVIVDTGGYLTLSYLPEDTAVGGSIFQISAGTVDAGVERTYAITSGNGDKVFLIDENNGTIFLAYPLDRETTASYSLGIEVSNTNNDKDTSLLGVTVIDANDNDPTFQSGNYVYEMPHGTVAGVTVATLTITDADTGVNASPTLTIVDGNTNGDFAVSGYSITTAKTLDANTLNLYTLVVTADDGGVPTARAKNATVTIHVEAEFHTPTYSSSTGTASLLETQTPGYLLYDCDATAGGNTEGTNGDLTYYFTSGNNEDRFSIEPFTGIIRLYDSIDDRYATIQSTYTLVVQAANRDQITLTSDFTLTISITQVNSETPLFGSKLYQYSVLESATAGTGVGSVAATDADVTSYRTVTYSLETNSHFSISTAGAITTTGTFEYSTDKSFNLMVYGVDDGDSASAARTGTSVVIVTVTDTNNNAPTFSSSPYTYAVNEAMTGGNPLIVLAGTDLDSGAFGTLTYTIATGNDNANFSIDASSGVLSLAAPVDYERGPTQFILTVEAADGGTPSLTGTATVTINVLDYNDEVPTFNNTEGADGVNNRVEVSLYDNTTVVTTIHTVEASDADSTAIYYSIQSGNTDGLFMIDVDTGVIQSTGSLVGAANDFYDLEVVAIDNGSPQLTGTTTVAVTVQYIDYAFTYDYIYSVLEEQAPPVVVDTIPADTSLGTISSYTITGGNIAGAFTITNAGVISTALQLDSETINTYRLYVAIEASVLNITRTVRIDVTDDNDNTPVFTPGCPVAFSLMENVPTGWTVGWLSASDADQETATNKDFEITFESPWYDSFFTIDPTTGMITADRSFNKEGYYNYFAFNVLAIDKGTVPQTTTCAVTISVTDIAETLTGYTGEEVDYTGFVSVAMPHDLATGKTAYTLTATDFNMTGSATFKSAITNLNGDSSFIVSTDGTMTISDNFEKYGEVTTHYHWVVAIGQYNKCGLVRVDTFVKNDNMVAVVTSSSVADVTAAKDTLLTNMQAKFTSPNAVRIYEIKSTDKNTSKRRKKRTTETVMMIYALTDDSQVDLMANVGTVTKTFLTQAQILAVLQADATGTPVSDLSITGGVQVTSVDPYDDGFKGLEDTPVTHPAIIAIVSAGCIVGFLLIVASMVFITKCCLRTRNAYTPEDEQKIAEAEHRQRTDPDYDIIMHIRTQAILDRQARLQKEQEREEAEKARIAKEEREAMEAENPEIVIEETV